MQRNILHTLILFLLFVTAGRATTHTITNSGFNFVPDTLNVTVGDTVIFDIENIHTAVEVSMATWQDNGTTSNGGFDLGFGGGTIVIDEAKTYYYICEPHAASGMKGVIIATEASAADEVYTAFLSGNQEVLPVLTTGTGQLRAELTGDQLVVTGSFSGLTSDFASNVGGTGAHLHIGYAGQNGGIQIRLVPTIDASNRSGTFEAENNSFTLTAEQLALLRGRRLYANIHTTAFPSGEIRGQLVPEADKVYYTNLFGSNEVPSVMSGGHGAVILELHDDTLVVSGSFAQLEAPYAASHLHQSLAGANGGVIFPLSPVLGGEQLSGVYEPGSNRFVLSEEQQDLLERRAVYANVHSARFPGGEIRGQVHPPATAVFRAFLSGMSEAPPVLTPAQGGLLFELDGDDLTVSGSFFRLSSDFNFTIGGGSHIHRALAGSNGGVILPLNAALGAGNRTGSYFASDNNFALTDDQVVAMLAREYYVNIHTTGFPAGELRGQIVPESQFFLHGLLSGTQEVTPVPTIGYGGVIGEVMGNQLVLTGSFNGLRSDFNTAIRGGAHLHTALAGANGPVRVELSAAPVGDLRNGVFRAANNRYSLTEGLLDSLRMRMVYVNIHSQDFPGGEIRSQLLAEAGNYFFAPLYGTNETTPVNSTGRGNVALEWNGTTLFASGAFSDLTSTFAANIGGGAHLHVGFAGRNGGVRLPLRATLSDDLRAGRFLVGDNTFTPGTTFGDTLRARLLYANIHTAAHNGGEIRGQVLPASVSYFTTTARGINEIPPVNSTGIGALKLEVNGNRLVATGGFADLSGDFDASVGGTGSHLHIAGPAGNGPVTIGLNATVGNDNEDGVYQAGANTFTAEVAQLAALFEGNMYFNVHTTEIRSGEIRGQMLLEGNFFPAAPVITAPAPGAEIEITGAGDTPFEPTWSAADDPDGDLVVYVWQLDTSASFASPVFMVNNGQDTVLMNIDFADVAGLLTAVGVEEGQTVKLYHRVVASDGSVGTPGAVDSVSLTLGVVTSFDNVLEEQFNLRLYPVPASENLEIGIDAIESARAQIQLFDHSGRFIARDVLGLNAGDNLHRLDVSRLPAGVYFMQVLIDGRPLRARKITVQR